MVLRPNMRIVVVSSLRVIDSRMREGNGVLGLIIKGSLSCLKGVGNLDRRIIWERKRLNGRSGEMEDLIGETSECIGKARIKCRLLRRWGRFWVKMVESSKC